jgi:hypothetical protein
MWAKWNPDVWVVGAAAAGQVMELLCPLWGEVTVHCLLMKVGMMSC